MIYKKIAACTVFCSLFFVMIVVARAEGRYSSFKYRVLDRIYFLEDNKLYARKLTLRYGDTDSQIVIVIYPGKTEILHFTLAGMSNGELQRLIDKMAAENPNVKEQEIAAKLKVNIRRLSIEYEKLDPILSELMTIQISPLMTSTVAVGNYSEYGFWCDNAQESVHYLLTGPAKGSPQCELVQWMVRFREKLPGLINAPAEKKQ
jgi:hypothetical protein